MAKKTYSPLKAIEKEALEWRGSAPVAPDFGDVYYSEEDGLAESKFVFLDGIDFPACATGIEHFTIGETGFGTGLNFLLTWKALMESTCDARLTFISVEGFPLTLQALKETHRQFPELADYAQELQDCWPPASNGTHRSTFADGRVTLLLLFGDVENTLTTLNASVDAWYLDGFSPAKNPDMWSGKVFSEIARTSSSSAKMATFTAASFVKEGLEAVGFDVKKTPGFGRKKNRLVGTMSNRHQGCQPHMPDWCSAPKSEHGIITIIGGGIAGAWLAYSLSLRDADVQIIDTEQKASSKSLPSALISPGFLIERSPKSSLIETLYLYAVGHPLLKKHMSGERLVELLPDTVVEKERLAKLAAAMDWPDDFLEKTEDGSLLLKGAACLKPEDLLTELKSDTHVINAEVDRIEHDGLNWHLYDDTNTEITSSTTVIVAAGASTSALLGDNCPDIRLRAGQLEVLEADGLKDLPAHNISYGGYLTASSGGMRTLGSSFEKIKTTAEFDRSPDGAAKKAIFDNLAGATSTFPENLKSHYSWRGVRAASPDYQPYAGPVPDTHQIRKQFAVLAKDAKTKGLGPAPVIPGLYMLSGLGSKGFQHAPLLSELLVCMILGEPLPLPSDQLPIIHPARDIIKKIIRGT